MRFVCDGRCVPIGVSDQNSIKALSSHRQTCLRRRALRLIGPLRDTTGNPFRNTCPLYSPVTPGGGY